MTEQHSQQEINLDEDELDIEPPVETAPPVVNEPTGQPVATADQATPQRNLDAPMDAAQDVAENEAENEAENMVQTVDSAFVYAVPYYTTPEGKIRVGLSQDGSQLALNELNSLVMEDHMTMQPLTNDSDTVALTVNLGVHKNAPPLQAANDTDTAQRLWVDADEIMPVAGEQHSYMIQRDGQAMQLGDAYTPVMDAAINRLDAMQADASEPTRINIKIQSVASSPALAKEAEVPGTASALNALHSAVNDNARDRDGALAIG